MKLLMEQWREYMLDESIRDDIVADLPRGVPEEKWGELVDYMRDNDPSGKSKYLRWIARQLWAIIVPYNSKDYTDERADELNMATIKEAMELIRKYDKLLPYIKASPEDKRYTDIGAIMGIGYLRNLVNKFEAIANKKAALKKSKMDDAGLARAEVEIIKQTENYILRRPHTTLACQRYSKGAPWCIGADNNNQFLGYMDENMVPYILEFTNEGIPHGHFLKKVAILTHYDSYDPRGNTTVDDQVYDADNKSISLESLIDMTSDIISRDEYKNILEMIRLNTAKHPPIEGGVGSDIGEKFLGDAEWDSGAGAQLRKAYDDAYRADVEEGRDYQKESEKIKDHPRLKKQVLDKGANKDTGGGKGHKKTKFKRGKSAPPMGEGK